MSPGYPFNIFQAIEWPTWVCSSIECPSSSWHLHLAVGQSQ